MIRCLIADDHPAILAAAGDAFERAGLDVVARARGGREAMAEIEKHKPDVAVVDDLMPDVRGTEVARAAAKSSPATAVLVYTAFSQRALLIEALDAGARGFVLKDGPLEELVRAIRVVAQGGTYVDPTLAATLASSSADRVPSLTPRERQVLRLLADGMRNEQIGKELFISPDTVRTHIRKAMDKLQADTRTQAVATALRQSLIA
ncbi:MAG: response regulator [Gaiella sp.]